MIEASPIACFLLEYSINIHSFNSTPVSYTCHYYSLFEHPIRM